MRLPFCPYEEDSTSTSVVRWDLGGVGKHRNAIITFLGSELYNLFKILVKFKSFNHH